MKTFLITLAATAAMSTVGAATPMSTVKLPEDATRNIVLVCSALVDGSSWRGVYDELIRDGYHVAIVAASTKVTVAAWHRVPVYGIVATEDRLTSSALQRFMYARGNDKIAEIKNRTLAIEPMRRGQSSLFVTEATEPAPGVAGRRQHSCG